MHTDRYARSGSDVPARTPTADPLTGRVLDGRYLIGPRIARGGMASVYEATDLRLDRTVAIKVMHPGLGDDEEFAARFVREARAAARLSHPNVVAVHDQGQDDGVVFLAMELVPGHTLRDTITKESPMPPARALALLEPVLSALASAHRAGLVHRDVKPENVLIATDPSTGSSRVKVADFGLAKAISSDTQHTATGGVLIGTVSYLAPELVVDGRADARADVYAAGVLLYELLTGRKPHEGESPIQVAYKHVHADVPPPSAVVPDLPPYVDALVARATARDRGQRPADAGVLLHHVHRVGHALADGVEDDEVLTEDLLPRPVVHEIGAGDPGGSEHTAPYRLLATGPGPDPEDPDGDAHREHTRVSELLPAEHEPTTVQDRPRKRGSRRGLVLLLVALLVATGVGAGAWWFGYARYTDVPAVVSLEQAAAVAKLEAAGLEADLGEPAYSETVPKGTVISADPRAGARVLDGGSVTLTVSLGKERYELPQLAGRTVADATDVLAGLKLVTGKTVERFSETLEEGVVISTAPAAGKVLAPGTSVDLVVSKGRKPIKVGDWVGKAYDDARAALTDRGLEVDVAAEEYSDSVPKGVVIEQDPRRGTLFRGDTVSFVVSQGPELVAVPDGLVASGVDEAVAKLEEAGFEVELEEASTYIGLRYVLSVDPGSGKRIPKGSTVTLFLV